MCLPLLLATPTCPSSLTPLSLLQVGKGQWGRVLEMVTRIRALDLEVCTTLGMLTPEQAQELSQAGLTAYNHNLDTSPGAVGGGLRLPGWGWQSFPLA